MGSTYVHLSGKNTDDAVLKMHGLERKEEVNDMKPTKCNNCNSLNPPGKERCMKCGNELVEETERNDGLSEKEMIDLYSQLLLMKKYGHVPVVMLVFQNVL